MAAFPFGLCGARLPSAVVTADPATVCAREVQIRTRARRLALPKQSSRSTLVLARLGLTFIESGAM